MLERLNDVKKLLESCDREKIFYGMDILSDHLFVLRESVSKPQWQEFIKQAQNHPVNEILKEAPQFRHCQKWPRGYMGDAEELDMIYGLGETGRKVAETSSVGRFINEHQFGWPAEQAVRRRRIRIANMIDSIACRADNCSSPHILSIACGHLREAHLSYALKTGLIGRFVAIDHDRQTLNTLEKEFGHLNIESVNSSIGSIFKGHIKGKFDFIYAAGLYDYLRDTTAKELTKIIFNMLNKGGRLLVANFTPETRDVGYMEVFMNWYLIYRTREEMQQFTSVLPREEIAEMQIYPEFFNQNNRVLYLEVTKV